MKNILPTLCLLVNLVLLCACSHDMAEEKDAPSPARKSFHKLAAEMISRGAPFDSIIAMQQKAVDELRRGMSEENPVDVLQKMGYLYCRAGQYELGADYLLEAVDSIGSLPPGEESRETAAFLFGNLANLYTRMNMTQEALAANRRALQYAEGVSCVLTSNLWRMRSVIFKNLNQPDSLLICCDISIAEAGPENKKLVSSAIASRGEYMMLHSDNYTRAELKKALDDIESRDYTGVPIKNSAILTLGMGKIYMGDTVDGIKLMEEALEASREHQDVEMIQYAEKHLLNAYAKTGRNAELARLFPEYDALCDTLMNHEKINSVMTSEFRFRTKKKDLETQMWKERSDSARKIIVLQWLAIVLAVLLASLIIGYALKKLRDARRSKELIHTRLLSMFAHQKEVNATIETLNSRIEQLNKEIEGRNDAENIQKLIAGMPSCLLSDSQEALFRRYFTQIYPHFIPDLRHDYPSITPNDELISMLIYMKYGSEEIALSLGISRQSVNTARYRLRKKLNLDKETDLDTFLTSRKG